MKKIPLLLSFILIVATAQAQYHTNFAFWNNGLNPDNGNAKIIKKEGIKTLTILAYEPDADDTASTITNEGYIQFDEEGRKTNVTNIGKDAPFTKYTYDKKGKVLKFSYSFGKTPEQAFEFEYDKKKGFKTVNHTGQNKITYDMEKSLLAGITETDTQYLYFNKKAMPEKYSHGYRKSDFAPGFYYSDTIYYTYDKKGNLASYKAVTIDKFGDTVSLETGVYTYNKKKALTSAIIKKYDMEKSRTFPTTEENHTYAISAKSGRLVNYSKTIKQNYSMGGEMHTDTYFTDEIYSYGANGLELSKSVSNNPGVVRIYEYRYAK
jgi:hypothetical protein